MSERVDSQVQFGLLSTSVRYCIVAPLDLIRTDKSGASANSFTAVETVSLGREPHSYLSSPSMTVLI